MKAQRERDAALMSHTMDPSARKTVCNRWIGRADPIPGPVSSRGCATGSRADAPFLRDVVEKPLRRVERPGELALHAIDVRRVVPFEDEEVVRRKLSLGEKQVPPGLSLLPLLRGRGDARGLAHAVSPFGVGRFAGATTAGSSTAAFCAALSARACL